MRYGWSLLLLITCGLSLFAQEQQDNIIRLKVHAAAAPVPALKYQLLPDASELKPGNAALSYLRAGAIEYAQHRQPEVRQAIVGWKQAKNDGKQPPVPQQLQFLNDYWPLQEMDRAARNSYCEWEVIERLRRDGFGAQLMDFHNMNTWSELLSFRCLLELEDENTAKAVRTCQTVLALGRHLADAPVLFGFAVGNTICNQVLDNVQAMIAMPQSPNLYWALTELPRPLLQARRPLQGERIWITGMLVDYPELEGKALPLEMIQSLQRRVVQNARFAGRNILSQKSDEISTLLTLKAYPRARQWLLDRGKPVELVDSMPTFQVVILFSLYEYRRMSDDVLKWLSVPYWQVLPHIDIWQRDMRRAFAQRDTFPLAATFLPSYAHLITAHARLERKIDLLRTIEALRLYAAKHGEWPERLEEIKEVPIPTDGYTGKPFVYRKAGNIAHLVAPRPSPQLYIDEYRHYELTLVK